ncbi:MAG: hypothetical protein ACI9MR_001001 [Myxococcota bacterium]|jgi:hypothetical protein
MVPTVRLPAVMADYACARTMVCCTSARVYLQPAEVRAIRRRLTTPETGPLKGRFEGAVEALAPDFAQLRHNAAGCVLLDAGERRCDLHAGAGLSALPAVCRSFPRVVAQTPAGLEVAFLMDCPTAAGLVASTPAGFAWKTVNKQSWPYEATRVVRGPLLWDETEPIGFDALTALREGWWLKLSEASTWSAVSAALLSDPMTPALSDVAAPWPILGRPALAEKLVARLCGLLDRGMIYRETEAALTHALHASTPSVLERTAKTHAEVFACALGLLLQFAGVHETASVTIGLRTAAWQTRLAAVLMQAITDATLVSRVPALQDALNVAALVSKEATYAYRE